MIVFDIETNGLMPAVNKIHCICLIDTVTGERIRFSHDRIHEGAKALQTYLDSGETLGGHNIIDYDIPVLEKLTDFKVPRHRRPQIKDSMVLSYLFHGGIKDLDFNLMRSGMIPKNLIGSHKLEAWGYRLGEYKGDYGKGEGDVWACWSQEMEDYCMQDVEVNAKIFEKFDGYTFSQRAITLEHEAQWLMSKMRRNGFPFDLKKAEELQMRLEVDLAKVQPFVLKMVPEIPDKVDAFGKAIPFVPKRDNKRLGYLKDVPVYKMKDFNPNSRKQVEWVFRHKYGYSPDYEDLYDITDDGPFVADNYRLKIDDVTMKYIKTDNEAPEDVKILAGYLEDIFVIKKMLGMLSDGKESWLNHYNQDTECIHGRIIPNATVSGRAAHSQPNLGQVPAHSDYGAMCRELFHPRYKGNDWVQVGVDAAGLELRCLAHYMSAYDGGEYGEIVLNGDIHTANQTAAGLPTRDMAKTFIYGFLYGAGDAKIGKIVNGTAADGKRLKKNFLDKTPAIASLRQAVEDALVIKDRGRIIKWKRKYLRGLDGRPLHVRSPHSALNLLLQSAGALVCKKWLVEVERILVEERGLVHGWDGDFAIMIWLHDEHQTACKDEATAKLIAEVSQDAMRRTQEFYKFNMQLDTDAKIGGNWRECH